MRKYFNKHILLSMAVVLVPATVFAADAAKNGNSFNPVLLGLLSLIIILLFVIGIMGSTLVQLGYAYRDKMRKDRADKGGVVKTLLLLVAASAMSFSAMAQEEVAAAPIVTAIGGLPVMEFYVLIGTIILELLIMLVMIILTRVLIKAIMMKPGQEAAEAAAAAVREKRVPFWDRFNAAVAVEKEEDILLDHDYDGIKELDNSLPPWWKYGFYLTIVIGVFYIWYYHFGSGPSQLDELRMEVAQGEAEVAEYLAKSASNVDENTVVMLGSGDILAGKGIFEANCVACHAADGGGNAVGPNLTDAYWLHGGSVKDIFMTIKYGWPSKGMKSWKDDFAPKQIAQLASFVKSLQGTTPAAPKEKQGELYVESASSADTTDSVKVNEVKEPEVKVTE